MIVVDALFPTPHADRRKWPYSHACHMSSDLLGIDGERELVAFAEKLGLKPAWIQHQGRDTVHFDLTPAKRVQAIKLGATEVDAVAFARARLARRKETA